MMRYHGTRKNLDPVHVQRVDAAWIHARGGEKAINYLQNKTVAIVGCGAVGSLVAETLVKAGVGELSFFDPDHLSWDNIARHALGGRYVGEEKGAALTEYFHKHFPHVHCTHRKAVRWEQAFSEDPEQLSGCDLVISTTGDYHSEAYLNYLKRTMPDFPSILFGWTEAHACAGHALLVKDLGGCLNCGMDETGNFQDSRNILAFMDLAEGYKADGSNDTYIYNSNIALTPGASVFPSDTNNILFSIEDDHPGVRNNTQISSALAGDYNSGTDYEKIESARLLKPSEYK
jgi:hypothetical protein